jgi:hypothetical protein
MMVVVVVAMVIATVVASVVVAGQKGAGGVVTYGC